MNKRINSARVDTHAPLNGGPRTESGALTIKGDTHSVSCFDCDVYKNRILSRVGDETHCQRTAKHTNSCKKWASLVCYLLAVQLNISN